MHTIFSPNTPNRHSPITCSGFIDDPGVVSNRNVFPDEEELEILSEELERTRTLAVDASSIIYLGKCGVLSGLSGVVELITVSQVVEEVGDDTVPVTIVDSGPGKADDAILNLAFSKRVPLVSEDRKLLLSAERKGVVYYNALLMLCLLLARGVIDSAGYDTASRLLYSVSRYNPRVRAFGESLALHIIRKR